MRWPLLFMANLIVYIDGFNFYYGAVKRTPFKWVNIRALMEDLFSSHVITEIKYFTAKVKPRSVDNGQPIRQLLYWRALKTTANFSIIEGSFLTNKKNLPLLGSEKYPIRAKICQWLCPDLKFNREGILMARVLKTEEKGSDVNIAAHLINDAHTNRFDEAILVSGDSDLCQALRIVTHDIGKRVTVVNPQFRVSRELKSIASNYRHIHQSELRRNQFPKILNDAKGLFNKPREWDIP
jgi:uncharacterized LabA/DUF88 family protein